MRSFVINEVCVSTLCIFSFVIVLVYKTINIKPYRDLSFCDDENCFNFTNKESIDRLPNSNESSVENPRNNYAKMKTILLWNSYFRYENYGVGFGNKPFVSHKCPSTKCYLTNKKKYLRGVENFDVLIFHMPTLKSFPKKRSNKQLYVMFSLESPSSRPIKAKYKNTMNITMNYRLDSDIHYPYFRIYDKNNNFLAPSPHPQWLSANLHEDDVDKYMKLYQNKRKPVAWFVSNCHPSNKRMEYVLELKKHIHVDIIGKCGNTTLCDRSDEEHCFELLKSNYYFYLSFENSNCVDYVTEKLYNAYVSDIIPVVMNGADMNTVGFPHSFLDVRNFTSPQKLADEMKRLISNPREYIEYFWWNRYYNLTPKRNYLAFCDLCHLLHNRKWKAKNYSNILDWVNGTPDNPVCKNDLYV